MARTARPRRLPLLRADHDQHLHGEPRGLLVRHSQLREGPSFRAMPDRWLAASGSTQTSFTLHGPQSMAELKTANACILFKEGMAGVSPYTGSVFAAFGMMEMVGENPDVSFLEIERSAYQTCMQRLRDGASDVIIMERTIAARILAQVQEAPLGGRRRLRAAAKSGALLPGAGAGDSGATEGQGACDELSFVSDIQFGTGDTYVLPLHRTVRLESNPSQHH